MLSGHRPGLMGHINPPLGREGIREGGGGPVSPHRLGRPLLGPVIVTVIRLRPSWLVPTTHAPRELGGKGGAALSPLSSFSSLLLSPSSPLLSPILSIVSLVIIIDFNPASTQLACSEYACASGMGGKGGAALSPSLSSFSSRLLSPSSPLLLSSSTSLSSSPW